MSEETTQDHNDGTWSGLKKTVIGGLSTVILAGGTWVTTTLFGGGHDKEETKTEQAAPAPAPVINITNSNANQQQQSGGTNTVIRERVVEKAPRVVEKAAPAEKKEEPKKKDETDSPW